MTTDWKMRAIEVSAGTQTGAILAEAMRIGGFLASDESTSPPRYVGKASVTSDGFLMCNFIARNGDRHQGAFVGSADDLACNIAGLAKHLALSKEETSELAAIFKAWIGIDWRTPK